MMWLAVVAGVLAALVVRLTTRGAAVRANLRKIHADLLEFRLFFDEPWLIWRAWMSLLRDNARLFVRFLPATLILGLPMAWLFLQLDTFYGLRALHRGESAVVSARLTRPLDASDRFELHGSAGVQVETPPIRAWSDRQIAWRIRPENEGRGTLDFTIDGRVASKSIVTGGGRTMLSRRRTSSFAEFLLHPEEPRLPDGDIAWLQVDYPNTGDAIPWLVWFAAITTAAAVTASHYV